MKGGKWKTEARTLIEEGYKQEWSNEDVRRKGRTEGRREGVRCLVKVLNRWNRLLLQDPCWGLWCIHSICQSHLVCHTVKISVVHCLIQETLYKLVIMTEGYEWSTWLTKQLLLKLLVWRRGERVLLWKGKVACLKTVWFTSVLLKSARSRLHQSGEKAFFIRHFKGPCSKTPSNWTPLLSSLNVIILLKMHPIKLWFTALILEVILRCNLQLFYHYCCCFSLNLLWFPNQH